MTGLRILRCGPVTTVQDGGRPGLLGQGISQGGAMDPLALAEGAALLGQDAGLAAIELAGTGGVFQAESDIRIALTGAPMAVDVDGIALRWNASHFLPKGARLSVGAAKKGCYGYLHLGGGVEAPMILNAQSAHLAAGLGQVLQAGDLIRTGPDTGGDTGLGLPSDTRFGGGDIRVLPSMQTELFTETTRARFQETVFTRDSHGNRMGVRVLHDAAPFATEGQLNILSEVIVPGDIQMTGTGVPFVLLNECQTTGGYPRIATVIPPDMPTIAQAGPGAKLRFRFVDRDEALTAMQKQAAYLKALQDMPKPLVRDPHSMSDLLSYNLISGAISAFED